MLHSDCITSVSCSKFNTTMYYYYYYFFYDNTVHNTADCTLPFSLGVVVAVAQHNHIKKKMDRKRVDDNNQNGRPERCETH